MTKFKIAYLSLDPQVQAALELIYTDLSSVNCRQVQGYAEKNN